MGINKSTLIILMDLSQELLTLMQMPLYSTKHSKKTFTNHQLFKLMVLKTYLRRDYRRFVDELKESKIPEKLGLDRIPHFTTLQKFAQRQNIQELEKSLLKFVDLAPKKINNVGFDATGFSMTYASKHYEKRIGRTIRKKDFIKSNIFFDLRNLLILGVKIRKISRHDMQDMRALWNKIKHLRFKNVFADKAYDGNWLHKLIFESGRNSFIHIKQEDIPIRRTSGTYRKKAKRLRKNSKKGKRSLCETINSVVKRVLGSVLYARNLATQKIELLFKLITYNLERIMKLTKNIFCALLFFLYFFENMEKIVSEFKQINIISA